MSRLTSDRLCGALVFALVVPATLASGACGEPAAFGGGDAQAADAGAMGAIGDGAPIGIGTLGDGKHDPSAVTITVVGSEQHGLAGPRDLAFHPDEQGQLWVVNAIDESVVIFGDATGRDARAISIKRKTPTGHHFLARPSGIAFGAVGFGGQRTFATIHETDQETQGPGATPGDFMGPTLYTSDLSLFDGGHGGHLDMMHNTPNGMGIAWDRDNVYWVFDGYHGAITRYDFGKDHGPGGGYHGDGTVRRYAEGGVAAVAGVPAHLQLDHDTGLLYVVDTGKARIAVLDTTKGTRGKTITPNYDGGEQVSMTGTDLTSLVDGSAADIGKPCGLALHQGVLYVSDNERSTITAFDLSGRRLDWLKLDRPSGSLMGLTFGPDGKLYVVDHVAQQVLRISASPE